MLKTREQIRLEKMKLKEKKLYDKGFRNIAGVDEAGRGSLAGPVVAAAVILPVDSFIAKINDSKKISYNKRKILYENIKKEAISIGISIVDERIIDRVNILQATLLAMREAINNLEIFPDYILVDGIINKKIFSFKSEAIIKGDSFCYVIAASSIVAKVTRDQLMEKIHNHFPQYGFREHKGYPTKKHKEALAKYGITPIHRLSFNLLN